MNALLALMDQIVEQQVGFCMGGKHVQDFGGNKGVMFWAGILKE